MKASAVLCQGHPMSADGAVMSVDRSVWTRRELATVVLTCYALFVTIVASTHVYSERVSALGDNGSYAAECAAILGRHPETLRVAHFAGHSFLASIVVAVLGVSIPSALALVSTAGSLVAVALAGELWGAWVAACFALANLDWIQRSLLGGPDPVFTAFVFGSLFYARRERWLMCAVAGAFATCVRPFGIFVLLALGLTLLWRRNAKMLIATGCTALVIGGAYALLARSIFGDPLRNVNWYGSLLNREHNFFPFVSALFLQSPEHPLTNKVVVKTLFWQALTVAGIVAALVRSDNRQKMREAPVEWLFGGLYFGSLFFFPASWVDGEYPRYFAPVIPLCLFALRGWLPDWRWTVWLGGLSMAVVAAVEDSPAFMQLFTSLH